MTYPRLTSLPLQTDWDGLVAAGVATRLEDQPQHDGDGRARWHGAPPRGISCAIDTNDRQLVAYVLAVGHAPREQYAQGTIGHAQWSYPKNAGRTRAEQKKTALGIARAAGTSWSRPSQWAA